MVPCSGVLLHVKRGCGSMLWCPSCEERVWFHALVSSFMGVVPCSGEERVWFHALVSSFM